MFALFLYLTLYLQSFLGYSPVDAGLRYLPITIASFIVAPLAGMALAKVQARYLMSAGLALTGVGLLLMGGLDLQLGVDRAAGRVHRQRHRRRAAEPGDRRRRPQRRPERAAAAWRPGSTTPSARSGSRSGSPPGERSSSAPAPRRRRTSPAAPVSGERSARAGRSDLLGGAAAGALGRPRGRARADPQRRRAGLPARAQHDPAARRAALLRRRRVRPVAGARGGHRTRDAGRDRVREAEPEPEPARA